MPTPDGEHHLRYMLLLGEGVPFVLRCLINREVNACKKSLSDILSPKEHDLRELFKHDSQFKKLFPSKGHVNTDLESWDIGLLSQILLDVFGQDLTLLERVQVKSFGYSRTDLVHRYLAVYEEHEFTRDMSDLVVVLLRLSANIDQQAYDKCQELVKDSASLDIPELMVRLRACHEYDNKMVAEIDGSVKAKRLKNAPKKTSSIDALKEYEFSLRRFEESLTKPRLKEIDFAYTQAIDSRIEIHAQTTENVTKGTILLMNAFHVILGQIPDKQGPDGIRIASDKIIDATKTVTKLIQGIDGASIHEVLYNHVLLNIKCANSGSMKKVLKKLLGTEFKTALAKIAEVLKDELGATFHVKGHVMESCILETENHLREQGLIVGTYDDLSCKAGHAHPIVMFCNDDEQFCCHICALRHHRACPGLRQTTQAEKINYAKKDVKEYSVRVDLDDAICWINGICALPNGSFLFTDENNKRLKKLDNAFNVTTQIELPNAPYDVCYMENDLAAVGLWGKTIQIMNVKEHLVVENAFELEHSILGIIYSRKKFFVTDEGFVYTYNTDGSGKHLLYKSNAELVCFSKMSLSADGEKIFIVDGYGGLETIDRKGNHLFTLREEELKMSRGISLSMDKTVLVCEYEYSTVLHLDAGGEKALGTILQKLNGVKRPTAMCFDKKRSKLIVCQRDKNEFLVYDLE